MLMGLKPLQTMVLLPQWRSLSVTIPHTGQTYLTCAREPRMLSNRHPKKPRSAAKSPYLKPEALNTVDIPPITIAPKGSGMRATIDNIFEKHNLQLNVVYETNDMDLQQRMVLVNKKGIAFMSIIHTQDPLVGKYCRKTLTDQCFGTVGLSYNKFRAETASTKMFKKFALEFFDNLQNLANKI